MFLLRVGLDVGSTTIKCVVLNEKDEIVYEKYQRHYAKIFEQAIQLMSEMQAVLKNEPIRLSISGTSGMNLAKFLEIPFVQEVYATRKALNKKYPKTDVAIELGGEDAKILFLTGYDEVCMNGSCAGGTGSFIDQMAVLLHVDPDEMEKLAAKHTKIYPIASRCGVFAKTDIQPLLNQGAKKEDIAASIFYAVVHQTIQGLAKGRKIAGNIVYLGGPLTFFPQLRVAFDEVLQTKGICPEHSLYFVAYGTALLANDKVWKFDEIINILKNKRHESTLAVCPPLFSNKNDYEKFKKRHPLIPQNIDGNSDKEESIYIGIDAGSTTLKAVVMNEDEEILFSRYLMNQGNPVHQVLKFLKEVYHRFPNAHIQSCATTGYGEEMIQNAFGIDFGIVETVAHFMAAQKQDPNVDFILDIGGQDIKCFKIRNHTIDSLFLNEACSSGCGSFLQTLSESMGYSMEDFVKLGLFAKHPVDLGSRCTVFMNSSVKQAQKDGISMEDISAGLSMSVVKNALYKVIRMRKNQSLGSHILVQGGTFLNDTVLRAFEKEIGQEVQRSNISGLMGAYGACLYAKQHKCGESKILTLQQLNDFRYTTRSITCQGCTNHCTLTINDFGQNRRYISGNQCNRMSEGGKKHTTRNMYDYKRKILSKYKSHTGKYERIGLPMALNMYEWLPFGIQFFLN